MLLTLGEVASALNLPLKKRRNVLASRISIDSRTVEPGALFFALKGERFDGHDFVEEALHQGAVAAVVERIVKGQKDHLENGVLFKVNDSLRALQDLAAYYRRKFIFPVIAVTGTNGKTTTKEMIAQVLSTHYQVMKTEGNLNNHIGVALSIFTWNRNGELAVVEMGTNHFGEIRRLCEIALPTHGVITNIGKGHIEFLRDEAGVARAKTELLEALTDKGLAFINGDDKYLKPYLRHVGKTITFGFGKNCDLVGQDAGLDRFGFPKMEVEGQPIRLSVSGRYNLYNALAAIAVGRVFGIPWNEIQEKLWRFHPVDKRSEVLHFAGISIVNDTYNANPSSVEQALLLLRDMVGIQRRIVVLGDMLELGKTSGIEHGQIGKLVASLGIDAFYSTGSSMRKAALAAQKAGIKRAEWFKSKQDLCKALLPFLRDGDGVLVKGSRDMKMEDVVEEIRRHFGRENQE
jgi:UDP-N-acetylmuramoyl-tripeptide--D-alanyl-D-alanine ligase